MELFLTIFFFIVIIGSLVFVHELGHFLTAKISGVEVKEFAIGFGRSIFSKTFRGTKYSINLIPLGGYVNLEGESDEKNPKGFRSKPFRVKFLVLIAGIVMNLLFAIILLNIYVWANGGKFNILPKIIDYNFSNTAFQQAMFPLRVIDIESSGNSYGVLEEGNIIVSINDIFFENFEQDFRNILKDNISNTISLGLINIENFEITEKELFLDPQKVDNGILGVRFTSSNTLLSRPVYFLKYNNGILAGVNLTYDIFVFQARALGGILLDAFSSGDFTEASDSLGGLPAVTNQVGQIVQFGVFEFLLPLTAFISISLAFMNILPLPALDGGQIVLYAIERLLRREIPERVISFINFFGFAFLIIVAILINVKDIIQLGWITSLFDGVLRIFGR